MLFHMKDNVLTFEGIIRAREMPADWTLETFLKWWPRMKESERDRYTKAIGRNTLMSAGRSQILTYIGATGGSGVGFAQYFAVGNGPIAVVSAGDTSLQGEYFRAVPSTSVITGTQLDIDTFFGTTQGNTTYTNAGLFGNGATGTSGSGTLETHSLYTYTKTSANPLINSYLITLN